MFHCCVCFDCACSDCGVHIDGYIAVGAHTFVVGVEKVTGRQADCIAAATALSDVAIRLLKAGNKVRTPHEQS